MVGLLAVPPPEALAGGFTIIEIGAKKTGTMCSIAKPDDLTGVYHNPAGIADLHGTRFSLSTGLSFVDISARLKAWEGGEGVYGSEDFIDTPVGEDGYFEGTFKPTRYFGAMPMLVASTDFGIPEAPVFALAVYVPDFIGAFLPDDAPTRYMATEAYFVAGMASLTVAYRLPGVMDWLAAGASLGVMYVRLEGKRWQNVHLYGDETTDYVLHLIGQDYKLFWNVGLTANPIDSLTLGFVFLGRVNAELAGSVEFSLPKGVEAENPVLLALTNQQGLAGKYNQTTHMVIPAGLGAGVDWQVIPELALAADFRWWFYDAFKTQDMYHDIDVAIGDTPVLENPMVTQKRFQPSWTISAGAMVRPLPDALPLDLMVGGTYDESPAPDETKSLDTPTTDLAGFSFGARWTFDEHWRLSVTYYHYWYLKDSVLTSELDPPQNSKFWGNVNTVSLQVDVKL